MAADGGALGLPGLTDRYDGVTAAVLAKRLGVPRLVLYASVGSTMDVAHGLAEAGTAAGTLVLADEQTAGRGRQGRAWRSAPGRGLWLTLVERPREPRGLDVLSLRVGLALARALDAHAAAPVRIKWPNDLFVGDAKLAGVLVETRWRTGRPDWVAIGIGVNVVPPAEVRAAAGLRPGTRRLDVLEAIVPAARGVAARGGALDEGELREFASRDYARDRRCVEPTRGVVAGVTASGEVAVRTPRGVERFRSGSLVLEGDA